MTTNTNQQVTQSETLEQIAERITRRWGSQYRTQLKTAIVEALRNEREACAKVADDLISEYTAHKAASRDDPEYASALGFAIDGLRKAASTIRNQ